MKRALCATHKGLIILVQKNGEWKFERDVFLGMPASLVYIDPRNSAWWISLAHKHWGHKMHVSFDKGKTWKAIQPPSYPPGTEMKTGVPAKLRYVWAFGHGGEGYPQKMYVGTEPGGLFVTHNYGQNFELVGSLWNHPSRVDNWFGGGRDYAGIHTVFTHPENDNQIFVGVSCGGVFRSLDNGTSWEAINKGLRADYLPNPHIEAGHDPHMMYACKSNPDVIWQQNHCGVYVSNDTGSSWKEVTPRNGIGDYGFALAIDHSDANRAWIIPAQGDDIRIAYGKSLVVCRTDDGGLTWKELRNGLPQNNFYDIVLRHALAYDGQTLIFGSSMGRIFYSDNQGESWTGVEGHFPKVNALVIDHAPS
jgi:hypothetical protein